MSHAMSHHTRWESPAQRQERVGREAREARQREQSRREATAYSEYDREARRAEKVNKVTDFLINRAALRRVTNMREVATATGIERHRLGKVLCQVAKNTWENDGVLLPAVIVHFNDNRPGHRFAEWAKAAGLIEYEYGVTPDKVHSQQLEAVFNKYSPKSGSAWSSACESSRSRY
jgi:hypothetical protein